MDSRILRTPGIHLSAAVVLCASIMFPSHAQVRRSTQIRTSPPTNSASHVAAEITKGKLNPAESQPGDTVTINLKDDVTSNGELILRKGTTITGVVRNVRRADTKDEWTSQAESMMEIEWLVPATQARGVHTLSFALQSVTQGNALYANEQNESFADDFNLAGGSSAEAIARPARSSAVGSGLLASVGGAVGSTVDSVTSIASTAASSRSNTALLSMPSVVAVDQQTSSAIESTLGSSSGQLFQIGHCQLQSASGSKQPVDFYSHLGNDTVITSPSQNFEISSGAQMQMLVGVNRR